MTVLRGDLYSSTFEHWWIVGHFLTEFYYN